jgi:hypothetical protein
MVFHVHTYAQIQNMMIELPEYLRRRGHSAMLKMIADYVLIKPGARLDFKSSRAPSFSLFFTKSLCH